MTTQTKNSLLLMLCSFIWGFAFVAQSSGSGMGAYSFLAGRSWLAVLVLIPTMYVFDALHRRAGAPYGWPKAKKDRKTLLTAGVVCGTFLFLASAAQQMGIILNPSTAKAGFLTGAGAGVRAGTGAAEQRAALGEHGHRGGRALPALHEKRLWQH